MGATFYLALVFSMAELVAEAREVAFVRAQEAACREAVEAQRKELTRGRVVGDGVRVLWSY